MTEELYPLLNCEIMRLDVDDEHYYYGGATDSEKQYYLSVTRVLDIGAPFPEGLRQYLRVSSYEEQQDRLNMTGARGSGLHEALDWLIRHPTENFNLDDYKSQYEKDAIVTFVQVMRFLRPSRTVTEAIVADPALRVAGTLDLKCIVDEWKIEALLNPNKYLEINNDAELELKQTWINLPSLYPKRICIIWDHKFTGRNSYSHKVQVAAYKTMANKSLKGQKAQRAFTWRYSPKHKHHFDFQESLLGYGSFKRVYDTTIEYLGEFPEPPQIRKYPKVVTLYSDNQSKEK